MSRIMAGNFIQGRNGALGEGFCTQLVTDERVSSGTLPKSLVDEHCLESASKCFTKRWLLPADRRRFLRAFPEWTGEFVWRPCLPPATFHFPIRKQGTFPPQTAQSKTLVLTQQSISALRASSTRLNIELYRRILHATSTTDDHLTSLRHHDRRRPRQPWPPAH